MIPYLPMEHLVTCFDATCKLIASIKILQREGKVDVLWKSVHHLFMAGLGVIYCLWYSKEIRDRHSTRSSISTLKPALPHSRPCRRRFPGPRDAAMPLILLLRDRRLVGIMRR